MNWSGANENSQSRRGHSTISTAKPSNTKQPIATHAAALMSCFASVWPPKKDIVMAAAAIGLTGRYLNYEAVKRIEVLHAALAG